MVNLFKEINKIIVDRTIKVKKEILKDLRNCLLIFKEQQTS